MVLWFSPGSMFLSLCFIGLSYLLICWYRKVKRFDHIPSPKYNIPVVGHMFRLPKDISKLLEFDTGMFKETKSKIRVLWLSFFPLVDVYDINIIQSILKSNTHLSKGATYLFLSDLLKTGLISSDGEKWKSRRRLLTPAFHFGILKSTSVVINHHASFVVQNLMMKISVNRKQDVQGLFKLFSLALLCETAMGVRCNLLGDHDKNSVESMYLTAMNDILDLLMSRVYKPWLHNDFIYKYLSSEGKKYYKAVETANNFVRNLIESRIKNFEVENSKKSSIFVDILLSAYKKNEIDIDGILEEVNTFMFAGHDTVSTVLGWTLYCIGKHEIVQEKLYDEIKSYDCSNVEESPIGQLKYLDCVVKESMRLYAPVPIVSRYYDEDVCLGGMKIPAGSTVPMHFFQLHRDESVWENPTMFLPERFSNSKNRNPFAYCPFSAGPRNCIGQHFALLEIKIVLCHLMKNFIFKSLQEESDMGIYSAAVLRSKNGIWLEIIERE